MDIFEKEQTIEAIRGIVRVRWFMIMVVVGMGFILKTKYFGSWVTNLDFWKIGALAIFAFGYNFIFWLFIRRPVVKISDIGLKIIMAFQVIMDQLMFSLMYYYSGTVESINSLLYLLTILVASSFYRTKGIVFTGLSAVFLCVGITYADYYKIIPHIYNFPGKIGWFGDYYMTSVKTASFIFYMGVTVLLAAFFSGLFRKREKKVQEQSGRLTKQAEVLTLQTQELTQTKDWLHGALIKSDKARVELAETKDVLEKANLELKEKIEELEKFNRVTVGRELKMAELKREIEKLKATINELKARIE